MGAVSNKSKLDENGKIHAILDILNIDETKQEPFRLSIEMKNTLEEKYTFNPHSKTLLIKN